MGPHILVIGTVVAALVAGAARAHDEAPVERRTVALAAGAQLVRSQMRVRTPDVALIDTRGRTQALAAHLDADEPVLLNFVYTTCSTICSTQTAVLAEAQRRLLAGGRRVRFVTLTIDPANDTPQRLAAFARQFGIERDWSFLTGDFDDLLQVQRAFDVYRGAKAAHPPVVLMRPARGADWTRIEGIAAPADLVAVLEPRRAGR
jgi:protein SCO1/2